MTYTLPQLKQMRAARAKVTGYAKSIPMIDKLISEMERAAAQPTIIRPEFHEQ